MDRSDILAELRTWGPTAPIDQAVKPIGISRSYGYELARTNQFPCRVIRVGSRYRVVTSSLIALLESA